MTSYYSTETGRRLRGGKDQNVGTQMFGNVSKMDILNGRIRESNH